MSLQISGTAVCASALQLRLWHSHHLFRNPVRLLFVCVPGAVHLKLGLKDRRCASAERYPAEVVGEAGRCAGSGLAFVSVTRWQSLPRLVRNRAL
jgi:hypothetical protein